MLIVFSVFQSTAYVLSLVTRILLGKQYLYIMEQEQCHLFQTEELEYDAGTNKSQPILNLFL